VAITKNSNKSSLTIANKPKMEKMGTGAAILQLQMITSVGRRSSSEKEDAAMVGLLNWERWRL